MHAQGAPDVARRHAEMAFDFAIANLAVVNQKVDAISRSRYFPTLAENSTDLATVAKVNAYAAANLAPNARRDAETAVANIQYRVKTRSERMPALEAWLATQ